MRSKKEIQNTIIYYLIDNNMSATELAEKLNCSRASIYRWMSNRSTLANKYYIKLLKLFENYSASAWVLEKTEEELEEHMYNN